MRRRSLFVTAGGGLRRTVRIFADDITQFHIWAALTHALRHSASAAREACIICLIG